MSPFSHLHPSDIELFDKKWTSTEHLYQYSKAFLGNDPIRAEELLEAKSGKKQKAIGNQVNNTHPHYWEKIKYPIMLRMDFEKYSQNEMLLGELLSTGDRPLLKNNHSSPFWGIPGNAAGRILMDLREHFRGN